MHPDWPIRFILKTVFSLMSPENAADFATFDRWLAAAGASWRAAEAHGYFCGLSCLAGAPALQSWLDELLIARPPDATDALSQERLAGLQRTAALSLMRLEGGQMNFALLLPADDVGLEHRASALADWCHGFMQGLAAGGAADTGVAFDVLDSAEMQEILRDFSEFTRASADAGSEADESAFVELVEYVRVSVQLIYDQTAVCRGRIPGAGAGS